MRPVTELEKQAIRDVFVRVCPRMSDQQVACRLETDRPRFLLACWGYAQIWYLSEKQIFSGLFTSRKAGQGFDPEPDGLDYRAELARCRVEEELFQQALTRSYRMCEGPDTFKESLLHETHRAARFAGKVAGHLGWPSLSPEVILRGYCAVRRDLTRGGSEREMS